MLQFAYLVLFTCKNRCRYSRKRATFCRTFAKNWQLPYGSAVLPGPEPSDPRGCSSSLRGWVGMSPANLPNVAKFWRARSWRYRSRFLPVNNMRVVAFFKMSPLLEENKRWRISIYAHEGARYNHCAIFLFVRTSTSAVMFDRECLEV